MSHTAWVFALGFVGGLAALTGRALVSYWFNRR